MSTQKIDYANDKVGALFCKLFFPTVLSMTFASVLIITDGIFVGRGLGSDALAAVNIVAPMWLLATGIGLMFGMGGSIVASLKLSHNDTQGARFSMTTALAVSTLILIVYAAIVLLFPDATLRLLGCSPRLAAPARDYLMGFMPFMAPNALLISGSFFVRLDGAPKFAMACSFVASLLNFILDYLFIFPFQFGVFGAAIATSIGSSVGTIMILGYLFHKKNNLHLCAVKLCNSGIARMVTEVKRMCQLGFPSLLSELAISFSMFIGNIVFIKYLGEVGVAAYSISCYSFPIIFMLNSSIAQSSQPIISFNYGINNMQRALRAVRIGLFSALGCSLVIMILAMTFSGDIAALFVGFGNPTQMVAQAGLPLYALCLLPFAVNIIAIGYFQSVEKSSLALVITILRGFVFSALCFWIMPTVAGVDGIWLAMSVSEFLACIVTVLLVLNYRRSLS